MFRYVDTGLRQKGTSCPANRAIRLGDDARARNKELGSGRDFCTTNTHEKQQKSGFRRMGKKVRTQAGAVADVTLPQGDMSVRVTDFTAQTMYVYCRQP